MPNEKVSSLRRKKKQNKAASENKSVQEVQENKVGKSSANSSATSEKQQNAADRIHTIQQDKPDYLNEGFKKNMETKTYRKIKCVHCGYEMASKAKYPMCSKCWSRKFEDIQEFSVTKPYKLKGGVNMAKETEAKKPEEEKKEVQAEEADELDTLFD